MMPNLWVSIYTNTYVTTDTDQIGQTTDQIGQIHLVQEELKVCSIGHDSMMEQNAVHIRYEAFVAAHLLDTDGRS